MDWSKQTEGEQNILTFVTESKNKGCSCLELQMQRMYRSPSVYLFQSLRNLVKSSSYLLWSSTFLPNHLLVTWLPFLIINCYIFISELQCIPCLLNFFSWLYPSFLADIICEQPPNTINRMNIYRSIQCIKEIGITG